MNITDTLKKLLAKRASHLGESSRHADMIPSLEAEENKLLPTLDLHNDADFKRLSDIRLKREICPRKVEQFAAAAAGEETKIAAECCKVASALAAIIRPLQAQHLANVSKALSPFISVPLDLEIVLNNIIGRTTQARILGGFAFVCSNTVSVEIVDPVRRAAELIEVETELAALSKS